MSALTPLADLLGMPVPAWIVVLGLAGLYAIQHVTVARRVERHVRMLSHLDRWANSVESRLDELGQGLPLPRAVGEGNRPPAASAAVMSAAFRMSSSGRSSPGLSVPALPEPVSPGLPLPRR